MTLPGLHKKGRLITGQCLRKKACVVRQPHCMAGTIDTFPMFFLIQNIFIVPTMQHGCHAKPLYSSLRWKLNDDATLITYQTHVRLDAAKLTAKSSKNQPCHAISKDNPVFNTFFKHP